MVEKACWTDPDKTKLIEFLLEHKAQSGDGANYKTATWTAASMHMANPAPKKGALKMQTPAKISGPQYLRKTFHTIQGIKAQSGWTWSDTGGAGITEDSKVIWDAYIKKNPGAAPFKNKGWVHLDAVAQIMPSSEAGTNRFHASGMAVPQPKSQSSVTTESQSQSQAPFPNNNEMYQDDPNKLARSPSPVPVSQTPVASKRKYPAASSSQSAAKRPCLSGASALTSLSNSVNKFGSTIRKALFPSKDGLAATPRYKMNTVVCAQELEESWLTGGQLISFINLLRRDVSAVDIYTVFEKESLCKDWVAVQLDI
ncbi:hypothetical protein B0H34DRAFT_801030 [Crassisporium funariophilum]|nr:hypothetical protein B0H34DRAFT_801030 [Crassisporium funariophilum]